jgi:hypothetical protein
LLKLIHCEADFSDMKQGGLQVIVFTELKIKVCGL